MRRLFFGVLLLAVVGCDQRKSIPPICEGTGTILLFREKNDADVEVFDQSLTDYLAAHRDMRLVSQRSFDVGNRCGNHRMKMVIMQTIDGHTPPPADDPAIMPLEKK